MGITETHGTKKGESMGEGGRGGHLGEAQEVDRIWEREL